MFGSRRSTRTASSVAKRSAGLANCSTRWVSGPAPRRCPASFPVDKLRCGKDIFDVPLLLMDEPTASLDPARRDELGGTLMSLTASGRTLLIATHDDDFVRDYADHVIVMAEGRVVEQGDPRQVLTNPQHPATRQLLHQALAERMTVEQFARSYAPGKWTAAQLFLHLVQTELAFSVRLRMALTTAHYIVQPFEQDEWLRLEPPIHQMIRTVEKPLEDRVRDTGVLSPEKARVFQHPERGEMRVGWILELLAGHDLHHLAHMEIIANT